MHVLRGLIVFVCAGIFLQAAEVAVWPVDALNKVFPHDPVQTNRWEPQPLLVARNGHTSLQFAIRSAAGIKNLNVRVTVPAGLQATVYHVGYVPVSSNPSKTPSDEVLRPAPAFFPDPLFEKFPYELPANRTDPIWITIYAPADTKPGPYRCEVAFEQSGSSIQKQEFQVRVAEAVVPAKQTLKVTNWFNLEPEHLSHFYKLRGEDERYWQVVSNIARVMAAHKQNVILTPVRELATPRIEDNNLKYDFSRLDHWVNLFEAAGVTTIEGGHLLDRVSGYQTDLRIPGYVIEDGKIVTQKLEPDDPRAEQFLDGFLSALYAHLKERQWNDRYIQHIHDEPHGKEQPLYTRYGKIIRRNLPGVPTIDAVSLAQDLGFFAQVTDIWVPVLGSFDEQMGKIREHDASGGQAWFYTCIYPQGRYLNRFTDLPLMKTRLLHWFNFRHNFAGFLHWGGNYWSTEPFDNVQPVINDGTTLLPAGDNAIVYPSPDNYSVLSSIRLEAMREGIEDYELLVDLSKRDPQKARRLAETAIPNFTDYVRDVGQFRKLQAQLLGL